MNNPLDSAIRRIPDFPKKGILFYDVTSILMNPVAFGYCIDEMCEIVKNSGVDALAAIEARGFIFAGAIADRLTLPLILVRKKGKLPGKTYFSSYALEYGNAEIEVHVEDVSKVNRVLMIDDLLATGGSMKAARSIVEMGGASVCGYLGVIGLPDLGYQQVLAPKPVNVLIAYHGA
jgi:adenine phosphoribosyltransferase